MFLDSVFRKSGQAMKYQQLALAIEHQIRQRTNGRVKRLEVQVLDGTVIVTGDADSYYTKQLAMEGIVDVLGAIETDIQLDIAVNYMGVISTEEQSDRIAHAETADAV